MMEEVCCKGRARSIYPLLLGAPFALLLRDDAGDVSAYAGSAAQGRKIRRAGRLASQYGRPFLTGTAVAARAAKRSIGANALRPSSVMRHPPSDRTTIPCAKILRSEEPDARRLVRSLHSRPLVASIAMSRFKSAIEAHPSGWPAKIFSTVT
jgi:hypothetical protein